MINVIGGRRNLMFCIEDAEIADVPEITAATVDVIYTYIPTFGSYRPGELSPVTKFFKGRSYNISALEDMDLERIFVNASKVALDFDPNISYLADSQGTFVEAT